MGKRRRHAKLVTTSGYGKAAFEFAGGKPLELLSGSHLLYLLEQHAGVKAKIEVPETWKDPIPDTAETVYGLGEAGTAAASRLKFAMINLAGKR